MAESSWRRDGLSSEIEAQDVLNIKALVDGRTVNGRDATNAEIFEENNFWRWRITDSNGAEYLDGGNYRTREQAAAGLVNAFDPTI